MKIKYVGLTGGAGDVVQGDGLDALGRDGANSQDVDGADVQGVTRLEDLISLLVKLVIRVAAESVAVGLLGAGTVDDLKIKGRDEGLPTGNKTSIPQCL